MSELLGELLVQLDSDPDDRDTQLVLADHLIAVGDPRGELIALAHTDHAAPAGLTDRDALERILLLAATYGFPSARNDEYPPLPWVGGGSHPVQYEVDYRGHHYYVRYRHGELSIEVDDRQVRDGWVLGGRYDGDLDDDVQREILSVLSDAIRAGAPLALLRFPLAGLPQFPGVPRRIYELPLDYRDQHGGLHANTYGLAARDYFRWHALWDRLRGLYYRASK